MVLCSNDAACIDIYSKIKILRNNSEASVLLSIREKSAVVQSNAGGLF